MFAFDLLVGHILCPSRLSFCFACYLYSFLKRSKLVWVVRAVFVVVCDSKQKTCLMKYSLECMLQTVDVILILLQHYAKFVWHVLVLWSFCSVIVFIDLVVACCFFLKIPQFACIDRYCLMWLIAVTVQTFTPCEVTALRSCHAASVVCFFTIDLRRS